MRTFLLFLIALLPAIIQAQTSTAPENPCANPQSQFEMNQCAAAEYKQADARLNKVYEKALQSMEKDLSSAQRERDSEQTKYEEAGIQGLKDGQQAWLTYRDTQCKAAGQRYEGGSMKPMVYAECLKTLTEHRIADLKSIYEEEDEKLE